MPLLPPAMLKAVPASAYIFERDGSGNWSQTQKLVASDRAAADYFGCSVAISGSYAIVGADGESEDTATPPGNTKSRAGSAYVFERNTTTGNWSQQQKLVAADRAVGDLFGCSVAISGNYAIVGAYFEDEDASGANFQSQAGSAYIFERDGLGNWTQAQKLTASDRAEEDYFGYSVAISGNYAIVGAYWEDEDASGANTQSDAGSAYVFERAATGNWTQSQKLTASDRAADDEFGYSVSISGDYAIVGAWQENEDASGANTQTWAGSAYIFERAATGNWTQAQKLTASDRAAGDWFGRSVSISGDYAIVGANREDEDASGANTQFDAGFAYIFSLKPAHELSGTLFQENNTNCAFDTTTENPLKGQIVKATPQGATSSFYTVSNDDGSYKLYIPIPDTATVYTIEAVSDTLGILKADANCPPFTITLDTGKVDSSGIDFGYDVSPCHHLTVNIASSRRRYCFRNTTTVNYNNLGSVAAPGSYVEVAYPAHVTAISSTPAWTSVTPNPSGTGNIYRFDLGTVAAGDFGSINIVDSVHCGDLSVMGLTQCTKATIFPAPDCPPSPAWSGAELSAYASCTSGGQAVLHLVNEGAANMTAATAYRVYLDSLLVYSQTVQLNTGDSLNLQVQANGKTVRIEADQVANHPLSTMVSAFAEGCITGGGTITSLNQPNNFVQPRQPNQQSQCMEITGSYDPNDKQAFPRGFTAQNIVQPGTEMDYLIRFQNTGTDTAFTVVVEDELSNDLDPTSFEMSAASHPYSVEMESRAGRTILRWTFNNILLPDSTTDEPGSNGFIRFFISPKANTALGTEVRNSADIYFDFNPPIITNQTLTTFDTISFTDPSLSGAVTVTALQGTVSASNSNAASVFPNPAQNQLTVWWPKAVSNATVTLMDLTGRRLQTKMVNGSRTELDLSSYGTGTYVLQVVTKSSVQTVKVIVK